MAAAVRGKAVRWGPRALGEAMGLFVSTFVNRIDRKGRVSVPATFRAALQGQSFHGVFLFPSLRRPAVEGCGAEFMERLSASVDAFDLFSDRRDEFSAVMFAEAHQLPFDGEGRVVLAEPLLTHAGITEEAAFVGTGRTFQIWNPTTFRQHAEEVRRRALSEGATLPVRPAQPGGIAT